MKNVQVGLLMVAGLLATSVAAAQPKAPGAGAGAKDAKTEQGYGYTFDDDPLAAGGFNASDATIKVRPKAARSTLIRPRIEFVAKMLKSVENL